MLTPKQSRNASVHKTQSQVIVFGASGDLAKRKIYPALHTLFLKKKIPEQTKIIGYGRSTFEGNAFIEQVTSFIHPPVHQGFIDICEYVSGGYADFGGLQSWLNEDTEGTESNRLFYLSLPPSSYKQVVAQLPLLYSSSGWNRVILEKPFGYDLASFYDLKEHVDKYIYRDDLFLIDHYLGKAAVEYMRKNGPLLDHPRKIEVLFSEEIGVEGRQYFDESGIIRDIVQNHLLQLVATLINPRDKLSVLKGITRFKKDMTIIAQYTGYPFSPSKTPTYVHTMCEWNDILITMKAGKALSGKFVDIILEYDDPEKNMKINIQPNGAVTGHDESLLLDFVCDEDAYEVLIRDVFANERSRFIEMDEIEESWKITQDILNFEEPLFLYNRGELSIGYKNV